MRLVHTMFSSITHPNTVRGVSACGKVYLNEHASKIDPPAWTYSIRDVTCEECRREIKLQEGITS